MPARAAASANPTAVLRSTPLRPAGTLFVERGTIVTVFIICYALTSFVGGCAAWLRLTACRLPVVACCCVRLPPPPLPCRRRPPFRCPRLTSNLTS